MTQDDLLQRLRSLSQPKAEKNLIQRLSNIDRTKIKETELLKIWGDFWEGKRSEYRQDSILFEDMLKECINDDDKITTWLMYLPNFQKAKKRLSYILEKGQLDENDSFVPLQLNITSKKDLIILAKKDLEQRQRIINQIMIEIGDNEKAIHLKNLSNFKVEYVDNPAEIIKLIHNDDAHFSYLIVTYLRYILKKDGNDLAHFHEEALPYILSSLTLLEEEFLSYHVILGMNEDFFSVFFVLKAQFIKARALMGFGFDGHAGFMFG